MGVRELRIGSPPALYFLIPLARGNPFFSSTCFETVTFAGHPGKSCGTIPNLQGMIERCLIAHLFRALDEMLAVCQFGLLQVRKTTLAPAIAERRPRMYLSLESEQDRANLIAVNGRSGNHEIGGNLLPRIGIRRLRLPTCPEVRPVPFLKKSFSSMTFGSMPDCEYPSTSVSLSQFT